LIVTKISEIVNNWEINIEKEKVLNFNKELRLQYEQMIKIYDSGFDAEMRKLLQDIFRFGDFVKDAFQKIKIETDGDFSIETILKLI
jgi:hypothetical protein